MWFVPNDVSKRLRVIDREVYLRMFDFTIEPGLGIWSEKPVRLRMTFCVWRRRRFWKMSTFEILYARNGPLVLSNFSLLFFLARKLSGNATWLIESEIGTQSTWVVRLSRLVDRSVVFQCHDRTSWRCYWIFFVVVVVLVGVVVVFAIWFAGENSAASAKYSGY